MHERLEQPKSFVSQYQQPNSSKGATAATKQQQQGANSSKGQAAGKAPLAAAAAECSYPENQGYTVCKIFTTHGQTVPATIAMLTALAPLHNHEMLMGMFR